jgi:hypothetical protein
METRSLAILAVLLVSAYGQTPPTFRPEIPRVWDDATMRELELPLASRIPVRHVTSEFYYQIPLRPNLKTYPIYAPGREPAGYWEWLQQQDPAPAYDPEALRTRDDWIKAGEAVFESTNEFLAVGHPFVDVRNEKWYEYTGVPVTKDGVLPYYRYVVRTKGKVEVTFDSCASCHTRVMDNGVVIRGGPGNLPFGKIWAYRVANDKRIDLTKPSARPIQLFFGAPWIQPDPTGPVAAETPANFVEHLRTLPPGVMPRQGTSAMYPPQVPDLIGVKERIYLDHTGLQQHRSIGDLMRYAAINNFIEEITDYDGFRPSTGGPKLREAQSLSRDSDERLYALALYLYSRQPPSNPNRFDAVAAKGKKVFDREGCAGCHTPPLYTNNKLTPASGFKVPAEDRLKYQILDVSVGTDPFLATKTRRGTGYYKVPSLKGVWYRGPFEHNGSVATLEDWFDARRLRPDYVPTGYVGYHVSSRAVPGHEFGLSLKPDDKRALIAFLKTL